MTAQTPLALRGDYGGATILVSGLSGDGTHERYLFLDLARRVMRETTIDITDLRARQLAVLRTHLGDAPVPYGLRTLEQLLPYFLHPHSFVQTSEGEVVVSFKQAPYLRRLNPDGDSPIWPPADALDFGVMQSSTKCELEPGVVGYGVTDAGDRLRRYAGAGVAVRSAIRRVDLRTGDDQEVVELPPFVLDTMHELNVSPLGFFVGVDMNLSVEAGLTGRVAGVDGDALDVEAYHTNPFPHGRFVVADGKRGTTTVVPTTASCSAHVDIDPDDPEVFYVSCNNISKWQNQVVVHGPGALDRFRYRDGEVVHEGTYSGPDFLRITSQEPFRRDGRTYLAVTGYPNRLFVLDPADMSLVHDVELFPHEPVRPPFACPKNTPAPLYVAVDDEGRYAFLTGATTMYVVDLVRAAVVDQVPFCEPGSLMATAHIGFVR